MEFHRKSFACYYLDALTIRNRKASAHSKMFTFKKYIMKDNVLGFDIPVDDMFGMRILQRGAGLGNDAEDGLNAEGASFHEPAKVVSFDEFHDQIDEPVRASDIKDGNDVGMT